MKIKLLFFSLLIIIGLHAKAQYVTIPDTNFVKFLQSKYPSCMKGNQMDTTCADIVSEQVIDISNNYISDLTGVNYFINLKSLNCTGNLLTSLPTLPNTLNYLECVDNQLRSLPSLPSSLWILRCNGNQLKILPTLPNALTELGCSYNNLTSLPALPNSLRHLECEKNKLTALPTLPNSLQDLYCDKNQLMSLPQLPNSLQDLYCNKNQLMNLPQLPNSLFRLSCENNKLTILPTLPDSLIVLFCDSNQLTSLPQLPDTLVYLYCNYNNLTSLPTLPDSLAFLYCSYNKLTSLPALPNALTELRCDNNKLTGLPVLPNLLESIECWSNQLSSLPVLPNLLSLICFNNQLLNLPVLPHSLHYLDCSNNNLTSLPVLPDSLSSLACYNNNLTSLPVLPNLLTYLRCHNNQITSLPVLPDSLQVLYCQDNNISCFPIFPNSLWSYSLYIDGNPFKCLPNYVPAMDDATLAYPLCMEGDSLSNPNGCVSSEGIFGYAYRDNNKNCVNDAGDQGLVHIPVKLYDGNNNILTKTYSATNGVYHFLNTAGTYIVKIDTAGIPYTVQCIYPGIDSTLTLTDGSQLARNVNFGIVCKPGFDVGVRSVSPSGWVFPGQQHQLRVVAGDMSQWYKLNCAAGVSGEVQIIVTGPVTYKDIASNALTPSITDKVFTYTIADFGTVNNTQDFGLLFTTDTTAQAGDEVCVTVNVTPAGGDNDTINNNYQFCYQVINSYDPNMKEVYPVNVLPAYQDWFTYTIHFQNTGNAPAFNIRLVDTLNANLDLESFQVINHSHYNTVALDSNVLTVRFPNIMLPDSTSNPEGSKGFVQYRIKPKANLPLGTQLKNIAYIYFDYNAPVVTNTTTNEYVQMLVSVKENKTSAVLRVYPNPGNGLFYVKLPETIKFSEASIGVYNILGELVLTTKIQNRLTAIDLSHQPNGIYIVRVNGTSESLSQRIIKQ